MKDKTLKLYIVLFVGVTEDQWFEDGYETSPLTRSEKQYYLVGWLFAAQNAEEAYKDAVKSLESDTDRNHDGPGHLTLMYNLGIHQMERVSTAINDLPDELSNKRGIQFHCFTLTDTDNQGIPLIRQKSDLELFRIPEYDF